MVMVVARCCCCPLRGARGAAVPFTIQGKGPPSLVVHDESFALSYDYYMGMQRTIAKLPTIEASHGITKQ